jgi:transketolase C-terminal domain/subunit
MLGFKIFISVFKPFAAVRSTNQITTAIKQQEWDVKV